MMGVMPCHTGKKRGQELLGSSRAPTLSLSLSLSRSVPLPVGKGAANVHSFGRLVHVAWLLEQAAVSTLCVCIAAGACVVVHSTMYLKVVAPKAEEHLQVGVLTDAGSAPQRIVCCKHQPNKASACVMCRIPPVCLPTYPP